MLKPALSVLDAIGIVMGIVLGAGIFQAPSVVAANASDGRLFLLVWVFGGALSFFGALCYAELASAYPAAGGTYEYLKQAFGLNIAFLFAWARLTVIQTGSIALLGFVFGDYATQLWPLGQYSPSIYALMAIIVFTLLNLLGIQFGKWTQNLLTLATIAGLALIISAGLSDQAAAGATQASTSARPSFGLMMIFVLLTYGGWSEAAYISAEVKNPQRNIVLALMLSLAAITSIYVLVNWALLHSLGIPAMAKSEAVAADLLRQTIGPLSAVAISLAVAFAALSSMNGTVLTGARTTYAMALDFPLFRRFSRWEEQRSTPREALLLQAGIGLALVGLGTWSREGFKTMVEYTAPVFWLFLMLAGFALFRLRQTDPQKPRPFRVPLYPVTPIVFSLTSAYLLYASLRYTGLGATVGVVVLLAGALLLIVPRSRRAISSERRAA
jgi:amino acid transporter